MVDTATVEYLVRSHSSDPEAVVVRYTDRGGYGVVQYISPRNVMRHVVHRWALVDTSSGVIPGGMLYSGGYYLTEEDAHDDFDNRPMGA